MPNGQLWSESAYGPSIVTAVDSRYDDLRVANNARWVAKPDSIVLVGEAAQIPGFIHQAVATGSRLSVKSGGHCYADFVMNDQVKTIIDVSRLDDVHYDHEMGAFAVEPGGMLLDTYKKLYRGWGVTIPGGSCFSVCPGGHVAGGGYGLLSRQHGGIVDHLHAVEVVCVDEHGQAHTVRATSDPDDPHHDLWWGHTGGGGGNFGVITKYWFRSRGHSGQSSDSTLIAAPKAFLVSVVAIPWAALDESRFIHLVDTFGRWHEENKTPDSPGVNLSSLLSINHQASGSVGLLTVIDADSSNADAVINGYLSELLDPIELPSEHPPIRVGDLGPMPHFMEPQRIPWLHAMILLSTENGTLNSPMLRQNHKCAYFKKGFTPEQIEALYRNLTRSDYTNPRSHVVLASYGGKINERPSDATASVQRSSAFQVMFQSFWESPDDDDANITWTRDVFGEVFAASGGYPVPNDQTDGCYINYPDMDIRDPEFNKSGVPWSTLYYGSNYERLLQVKRKYDPLNVFHHSQSIGS